MSNDTGETAELSDIKEQFLNSEGPFEAEEVVGFLTQGGVHFAREGEYTSRYSSALFNAMGSGKIRATVAITSDFSRKKTVSSIKKVFFKSGALLDITKSGNVTYVPPVFTPEKLPEPEISRSLQEDDPDADLVAAVQNKDDNLKRAQESFDTLYQRHKKMIADMVNNVFKRNLKPGSPVYEALQEHRSDVEQNIMIKMWDKADSFTGESRFATWLGAVAMNEARTMRKKVMNAIVKHEINGSDILNLQDDEGTDWEGWLMNELDGKNYSASELLQDPSFFWEQAQSSIEEEDASACLSEAVTRLSPLQRAAFLAFSEVALLTPVTEHKKGGSFQKVIGAGGYADILQKIHDAGFTDMTESRARTTVSKARANVRAYMQEAGLASVDFECL